MRQIKFICCVASLLSAAACIVLPVIGANSFFSNFRVPYSVSAHFELLSSQLVGPVFTVAFCIVLLWSFSHRKYFPWWIASVGLLGSIYPPLAVGSRSHDFSHSVFAECSNVYGSVIGWLCVLSGLTYGAVCLIMRAEQVRKRTKHAEQGAHGNRY